MTQPPKPPPSDDANIGRASESKIPSESTSRRAAADGDTEPAHGLKARWRYRERVSRLERITSDPTVCHGQPTIRGLRYTVESVLELLSAGMTIDEVLTDYPDLERDDVLAALEFGARAVGGRVVPLSAARSS
jgi:uncharacterized protein (DUF433 family)